MRILLACLLILPSGPAIGTECQGSGEVAGTSRVVAINPTEYRRVGTFQYRETLPLNDHEVVLTFDDGPSAPYTTRILDTLASNCVKATFFVVGRMAKSNPELVRRAYSDGHTIASHTETHALMGSLSIKRAEWEIQQGIASVTRTLGDSAGPAPFFRFPGLQRSHAVEKYLESRGVMIWSVDAMAGDWHRISPAKVVERSLAELKRSGKGILLLHDIHERTAEALPNLLNRLNLAGYHIVHVVPFSPESPKSNTAPPQ